MRIIAKLRRTAAHLGWWNTLLFGLSRVLHRVTGGRVRLVKYYFVVQPVRAPQVGSRSGAPRSGVFQLRWVERDCPVFAQVERPPAVLAARFARGARCLLATRDAEEFAGFLWLVIGPYEEDEVRARFIPQPAGQVAWDFDVSIAPRFRAGRLFGYLWDAANAELAAAGVWGSMSRISAFNAASLTAHQRLGARIVGRATFVCLGRWQWMISSLRPRWHWAWREDQRPELVIEGDHGWRNR